MNIDISDIVYKYKQYLNINKKRTNKNYIKSENIQKYVAV